MRYRSPKMAKLYVGRRALVARLLEERPLCQRCSFAQSTELHEVKSRARGGSIMDEENCRALCHDCHAFITTHPRQGVAEGFLKNSWEPS